MDRYHVGEAIGWIGRLPEPAYAHFREDLLGPDAFLSERERAEPLAIRTGQDPLCVRIALDVLAHLYAGHHDRACGEVGSFVDDLVAWFGPPALSAEGAERRGRLGRRLAELVERRASADLQRARARAIRGFGACAREFDTLLDLRPIHASGGDGIEELVPVVQLRIRALSEDPSERDRTYQLDRVALRRLRDAVAAAERQMDVVAGTPAIGALVHGSPLRRVGHGGPRALPGN